MVDITGLCFVLADGRLARFVRPGPDNRLHTIQTIGLAEPRVSMAGTPISRHPDIPGGEPPTRFSRCLAQRLNHDHAADLFRFFVLAAPPPILRELLAAFDGPTRASLVGCVASDLVLVPDAELWPHLDEWVQPASVA